MKRNKFNTAIIMPYLSIERCLQFSNLLIWPYHSEKRRLIKDKSCINHIDRLIARYKSYNNRVVQNPTIISNRKVDFSNPNSRTGLKIEVLKNSLLISTAIENFPGTFITSDNFKTFYQRFTPGDNGIAIKSGSIYMITDGGYEIEDVTFFKPEYVQIAQDFKPDFNILLALESCLNDVNNPGKSQIIQSLNPFFCSFGNSEEYSISSRILNLIMAFELLFGETVRKNFRKNIQKYSTYGSSVAQQKYKYRIVIEGRKDEYEVLTLNQIWAEEFYKLRHRIIHGKIIYKDQFNFNDLNEISKPGDLHFHLGVKFFVVCLLNKLREIGFNNIPHLIIIPRPIKPFLERNVFKIKCKNFAVEDEGMHIELLKALQNKT